MSRFVPGLVLLLIVSTAGAQGVYRWVDENGVTHFGDTAQAPQAVVIEVDTLSTIGYQGVTEEQNSQQEQPAKRPPPKIVMYSAAWCGVCKKAKAYFEKNGINYTEYDVDTSSKGKRDYKKMKVKSVPQFVVDGKAVRGFSRSNFDKLLGLKGS